MLIYTYIICVHTANGAWPTNKAYGSLGGEGRRRKKIIKCFSTPYLGLYVVLGTPYVVYDRVHAAHDVETKTVRCTVIVVENLCVEISRRA